jgi:Family of unknown function (DUF5681)
MSDNKKGTYEVGYRKPPKESRFQKGRSGNPQGRPKGSKPFLSLLTAALEERVWINEGGRRRSISKREALAKQFANKVAAGDIKAAKVVLQLLQIGDRERGVGQQQDRYADVDGARERLRKFVERVGKAQSEENDRLPQKNTKRSTRNVEDHSAGDRLVTRSPWGTDAPRANMIFGKDKVRTMPFCTL